MIKVIQLKYSSNQVNDTELQRLYKEYPDLKGFLGNKYHVEYDGRDYWVVGPDVDLLLDLFLAIARSDKVQVYDNQTVWVTMYDGSGNAVSVVSNKLAVRASELETILGEVQANPTANTALDRLKTLATLLAGGLPAALTVGGGVKAGIVDALPAGTNTIGGIKVIGNDTLLQGNLTGNGAAQQLNADTACKSVTIQAEPTNTGYVYIGLSTVSPMVHMVTLGKGSSMTFLVSNLNKLYFYATVTDKISFGGEV